MGAGGWVTNDRWSQAIHIMFMAKRRIKDDSWVFCFSTQENGTLFPEIGKTMRSIFERKSKTFCF